MLLKESVNINYIIIFINLLRSIELRLSWYIANLYLNIHSYLVENYPRFQVKAIRLFKLTFQI